MVRAQFVTRWVRCHEDSDTTECTHACVAGLGGESYGLRGCRARGLKPRVGAPNLRAALPLAPGALLSRPVPQPCTSSSPRPTECSGPQAHPPLPAGVDRRGETSSETVKAPCRSEVRWQGQQGPRPPSLHTPPFTSSFTHSCIVQRMFTEQLAVLPRGPDTGPSHRLWARHVRAAVRPVEG